MLRDSLIVDLLCGVLVFAADADVGALAVSFAPLTPQLILELVNFGFERLSEILEGDYDHGDVVERARGYRLFQDLFDGKAAVLVDGLAPISELFLGCLPTSLDDLSVRKFVENAVAAENDKVVVFLDFEALDVWSGDDHLGVAAVFSLLRLDVAKRARDREPAREHAVRPQQNLVSENTRLAALLLHLGYRLGLVDLAAGGNNAMVFILFVGLVVVREGNRVATPRARH